MAFNYEYPYTDTSRVNADWFLETAKKIGDIADGIDGRVHGLEQDVEQAMLQSANAGEHSRQVLALAQVTENEVEDARRWASGFDHTASNSVGDAVRGQITATLQRVNDIRMLVEKNAANVDEALRALEAAGIIELFTDTGANGYFDTDGIKRASNQYKIATVSLARGEAVIVYTRGVEAAPLVHLDSTTATTGMVIAAASETYHTFYYHSTEGGEIVAASYRQGEIANVIRVNKNTGAGVDYTKFNFGVFSMEGVNTFDQIYLTYDGDRSPAQFNNYVRPATRSKMGLMSAADKTKLDSLSPGGGGGGGKVRIDFDGDTFSVDGRTLSFYDLYSIHLESENFSFVVYGDRAYLLCYVQDGDGMKELRFQSVLAVTDASGLSYIKTSGIYVTSTNGLDIANVAVTDVNSENKSYKANAFDWTNEQSEVWYPSMKAVSDLMAEKVGDVEDILNTILEWGVYLG